MPRKKLKRVKKRPSSVQNLRRELNRFSRRLKSLNKKGNLSIFAGVFLIILALFWQNYRIRILSFEDYPETNVSQNYANPTQIIIPKVGMELEVFEGSIKNGIWETTEKGAVHLDESTDPGAGGNIVIYGHNKNLLFGPIRWLSIGDKIELIDANGKTYNYQIVETKEVNSNDIQYVLPKDTETLTLYTCTGIFDSKRYIIIAKPNANQEDKKE